MKDRKMKNIITNIFAKLALVTGLAMAFAPTVFAQTTYELQQVTSVSAGGKYVFEQDGHVMNNTVTSSALQTTSTYKTTGLAGTETYVWTLESATGGYYLKNVSLNSNQYLNNASNKTNVSFGSKSAIWSLSFQNDNTVRIQNTSNSNRFLGYTTASSYAYKAYATSNLDSDTYPHAIKVYQLVEESSGSTTYTVTYDANGGTGTMTDTNSPYTSGATVTVLSNKFTRDGYTFSNWNTAENGSGQYYSAGGTFTISANTTLYAQWTSNAAATTTDIDASGITNTDVYVGTAAGSLSASVTAGGNAVPGATVTWSGNNDDVATINENGVVTLVAAGTVTFTASYAGQTGTYQASFDTYEMTVTSSAPYVQPTEIEITPNYSFWGKNSQFSGTTYSSLSGSKDNVSLAWSSGTSGNTYANTTAMRFYPKNSLVFSAPDGYEIKSIELTVSNTYTDLSFSPIGWDSENTIWSGSSKTVTMSRPSTGSSYAQITKFTITIGLPSSDPVISADDVEIPYDATGGSIDYTVSNPVDGGTVSAESSENWLTVGSVTGSSVAFTCTANEREARTATVTLTYTYNTNETVTKDVTVTQAAAPVIYSTIPALFEVATGTETNVLVTFNNWVVSSVSTNGKNIFVTDNSGNGFVIYYSSDQSSTFSAGKILSGTAVSCTLKLYNGFAELLNVNSSDLTINDGGSVTVLDNIAMSSLSGVNTGAVVKYENLSCSYENSKWYLSDGATTIQVFTSLYNFESSLKAGKQYDITGVYQQYNATKEILPRSAADIEESAEPSIVLAPSTNEHSAEEVNDGSISITYNNIVISSPSNFTIKYYDSNEVELAEEPEWIASEVQESSGDYIISYLLSENEGEARTAYIKVLAGGVYSNIATITQAAPAVDYATLPFSFNDGKGSLPSGLTQSGLGSDYASSTAPNTQLKFDGTGDWLKLKINGPVPGTSTLAFEIKSNSFSGGTFTVQVSADDETYTDLKVYTTITDGVQKFDNIPENVRYIKWVYTTKSSGNVGLGNIKIDRLEETDTKPVTASLNGGKYWATFYCNGAAYSLPSGAKAYTLNSSKQLYLLGNGSVIPANTAVIIIAEAASITLNKVSNPNPEIVISGTENILKGSSYGMDLSRITGDPYVLGIQGVGNVLSFYKYTGTTVPENKAYYTVNE